WFTMRWTGTEWVRRPFTTSDHNYDHGSLHIEPDGLWRIVAPTLSGNTTLNASGATPWVVETSINTGTFTLNNTGSLGVATGGGTVSIVGTITNNGSTTWSNGVGWTHTLSGATVNNAGTITFPGSLNINEGTNPATINNTGTLTRTAGGTLTFNNIDINFNAGGQFNHAADSGQTNFNGATFTASPTHTFNVESGRLRFSGASLSGTFRGNATGTGALEVNNSSSTAGTTFGTTGAQPWEFTGTYIPGLGATSTGRSAFTPGGGGFTLQGTFTNSATGQSTWSNGAGWTFTFSGSTYNNQGTLSIPGTLIIDGGTINNSGTITRSAAGTFALNTVAFNNSGLITQPTGSNGTIGFNGGPIVQTGPGTLRATTNSRLTFNNASRDITGGRLEGSGFINANGTMNPTNLTIAPGDANPAVGTLTMDGGNLTLNAGDALEVSLDRPSGTQICDQFRTTSFSTAVNITGADLIVRRPSPTYTPDFNVEYVIIDVQNGGTLTGTFASVIEANPLADYGYRLTYTPTQVRMRVVRKCNVSDVAGANQVQLFDGQATADDIIVFLNWYFANDLRADFAGPNQSPTPDGVLTADDIIRFLNFYFAGCGF
ncbi:MAG: hypothetical protein MUE97_06485, partial [Phycisphaerales bacterium]|nr:hypothetical protein [Phycisphaerales bacterium]